MTKFSKKKILITGGLGFIGSHIVNRLHGSYEIVVIDNDDSTSAKITAAEFEKKGIQVLPYNIADFNNWSDIKPCNFIFHGAAQTSAEQSKENPLDDFRSNAIGTIRIAEFAGKNKCDVIYCNSIRVYEPFAVDRMIQEKGTISENDLTVMGLSGETPPFVFSKLIGEQYLQWFSKKYGFRAISHRLSGIVGPGQRSNENHGWISYIVKCAIEGKIYRIFGNGDQTRDILHIDDFVSLVEMELVDFKYFSEDGFAIYNIGGGTNNRLSINDVVKLLKEDHELKLKYIKEDPRIGEPLHYATNLDKIKTKGWPLNEIKNKEQIISDIISNSVKK